MCGIYFSSSNETAEIDNKFLIRGPDHFNFEQSKKVGMSHSLLSLTGDFTPQPVTVNNVKLVFNGQIYNYDKNNYSSDSYFIVDQYLKFDMNFWTKLDGEYAIIIYDTKKNKVIFLTDIFGSKPLYYSLDDDELSISSLISTLDLNGHQEIVKCSPNTIYMYDLNTRQISETKEYFKFNLDQYKTSYDDWNEKFHQSIEKRFNTSKHDIILPLSSGHDSGAIACALKLLDIDFYSYSFFNNENRKILSKRLFYRLLHSPFKTRFKKNLNDFDTNIRISDHLEFQVDNFFYGDTLDNLIIDGKKEKGAIGLTFILEKAKKINRNIKIVASGQGGDEIYSCNQNYTFGLSNPSKFDYDLEKIFPWQNFYLGSQVSYLSKEEAIGGSFGLETRYPFLDKTLVQEYLNLTPDLKNKYYKSPLTNYLITNNYPFVNGYSKLGFNP
jgi:asparagine synthetase B (glutamine-hydrolysing)